MPTQQPPPSDDFASEHAEPAARPISPTPDGPLEGFDPDRAGWGKPREPAPAWEQFKAWWRGVMGKSQDRRTQP